VRNARVILPLVFFGKWQYTQEGILDWIHTKFFTSSTIRDLLHASGLVQKIEPEFLARPAAINTMTFGMLKHLLCFTYNFSARPAVAETLEETKMKLMTKQTLN
jgi:hypothetical protein